MAARAPRGYGANDRRKTGLYLWLGVVATNMLGLYAAVFVSSYLRAGAGQPDTLFGFYYAALGLAGLADALWLDEIAFGGAFRRALLSKLGFGKGSRVSGTRSGGGSEESPVRVPRSGGGSEESPVRVPRSGGGSEMDEADVVASMRGSAGFPLVLMVCCGLTYVLFNLVNHGFNAWWKEIGEYGHVLRNPAASVETKQHAIVKLSAKLEPEVLALLEPALHDGDPQVEAYAAWAIGRQKTNEVMNINRVPALVDRVRNGAPPVRREAMLALARLQHQAIADEVQAELAAELEAGGAIDLRLIWGLGYLQHKDSLPVLDKALYHPDESVQRLAAWALSQHGDSGKGRAAVDLLDQRLPAASLPTKCAIVHSLGVLGDERSNIAIMHAYDGLTPEQHEFLCEPITVVISPDGKSDSEALMTPKERYGIKTLLSLGAMRATTPEIRAQVEPWLEAMIANPQTADLTRESAKSLLSGIRKQ